MGFQNQFLILQCYVACIYSACGPDLLTVAELTVFATLNSSICHAEPTALATLKYKLLPPVQLRPAQYS